MHTNKKGLMPTMFVAWAATS